MEKKLKKSKKVEARKQEQKLKKIQEEKAQKKKRKLKKKAKRAKKKKDEGVFVPVLSIILAAVFFLLGGIMVFGEKVMEDECTAETTGVVVLHGHGKIRYVDPVETKYAPTRRRRRIYWRKIAVETDGRFTHRYLYTTTDAGNKGDEVVIHYDPNDPDEYYVDSILQSGRYTYGFLFGVGIALVILSVYLFIYFNMKQHRDKNKGRSPH